MKPRIPRERILLILLAIAVAIIWWAVYSSFHQTLAVTFLDVGEGDAILVQCPSGRNMLIDGGGSSGPAAESIGERVVLPALLLRGIRKLDLVVLTHPHNDHVGGLVKVIEEMPVGMVLDSGQPHPTSLYEKFLVTVEKEKVPYKLARAGQTIRLAPEIEAFVIHPSQAWISGNSSNLNNGSVVIQLVYRRVSFLLTGDIEAEAEEWLLAGSEDLPSTVLKVGHHGSDTSSTEEFLRAVSPKLAVISVGEDNHFGHPSPEVLDRLHDHRVKVYRTDLSGAITVTTNGQRCKVESFGKH